MRKKYARVQVVDHPAYGTRRIKRCYLIWWRVHKQTVPKGYDLHHRNGNTLDDSVENLELISHADHASYHSKIRGLGVGIDPPWNKGKKGLQKRPDLAERNRKEVWTEVRRKRKSKFALTRTDLGRDELGRYSKPD